MNNIRNFCIIAHIDHGKSTLADRFLELTNTVPKREMRDQILDNMDLERERGITIKLQPVRMEYVAKFPQTFILNLIDTPGHVDFSYEVSRSLQAVEGAILLVDASQGVEGQTLANLYLAVEQNLAIIPVVNKIDLPNADVEKSKQELIKLLGCKEEEILTASGKTGEGVAEILDAVIERVPAPTGDKDKPLQALIFDSKYDDYRGVVVFVRVVNGQIKKGDQVHLLGVGKESHVLEVGIFKPKFSPTNKLEAGEIGYIVTGFKEVAQARVGDTVTRSSDRASALPGYKQVKPMVFAGFFPETGEEYPKLREAVSQIKLSDAALSFESEHSPALGFGFRCGFLGMLHMEIIAERLKREHGVSVVITTPSVAYQVEIKSPLLPEERVRVRSGGTQIVIQADPTLTLPSPLKGEGTFLTIHSPLELPDPSKITEIREPWAKVEIVTPVKYIGPIMSLVQLKHGLFGRTEYLDENRVILHFEVPLAGLITDFYDKLKSVSSGYASLNYEILDFRAADVIKLDILVAEEIIEAFSIMVNRADAYEVGKRTVEKLKEIIPKQQFVIKLQAAIGSKIIAAERIPALRKDVTAKLYGGDVTRKMKLLKKQKEGKKKMLASGKVEIPSRAFLEVLKR